MSTPVAASAIKLTAAQLAAIAAAESAARSPDDDDAASAASDDSGAVLRSVGAWTLDSDGDADSDSDEEPLTMGEAVQDPEFNRICNHVLKCVDGVLKTYSGGKLRASRTTAVDVGNFVFSAIYAPLQGYAHDEDKPAAWICADKKKSQGASP